MTTEDRRPSIMREDLNTDRAFRAAAVTRRRFLGATAALAGGLALAASSGTARAADPATEPSPPNAPTSARSSIGACAVATPICWTGPRPNTRRPASTRNQRLETKLQTRWVPAVGRPGRGGAPEQAR